MTYPDRRSFWWFVSLWAVRGRLPIGLIFATGHHEGAPS